MKALRMLLAAMLVLGVAVGLAGCGEEDIAARVNGEVIKQSDLDAQIEALKEQYPDMFTGADGEGRLLEFQQRLLDNMINNLLIKQAAEERGIDPTDEEVQTEVDSLKSGFETDEQFEQALAQSGMDVAALETQVREGMITEQLIATLTEDVTVSEDEIAEYYEANKADFMQLAGVHAAHILFDADDKETAEQVLADIKAGADFAALAKQYSKDPGSAANGGDLGWPTTPYVQEFQDAADAMEPGEISDLVESTFGWHIIKVIEKRDDRQQPIEEVKDQIEQIIIEQQNADVYQEFLNELRAAATIEILVPELATPAVTQEGSSTAE